MTARGAAARRGGFETRRYPILDADPSLQNLNVGRALTGLSRCLYARVIPRWWHYARSSGAETRGKPVDHAQPKLPVWATIAGAYRFVFQNLSGVAKVATVPYLLFLVLYWAAVLPIDLVEGSPIVKFLPILFILLIFPFLTKWHRVTLRGPTVEKPRIGLEVGRREVTFLSYLLVLFIIAMLIVVGPAFAFMLVAGIQYVFIPVILLFPTYLYLASRVSLVFPATALGRKSSLAMAWRQSAGNGWRLFWVYALAEIPWHITSRILDALIGLSENIIAFVLIWAIYAGEILLSAAVLASCLSLAYKHLVDLPPAEGEASAPSA